MASVLNAKHFQDEKAAYRYVEEHVWPDGPVCPHCGGVERISKMNGKSTRIGAYKCYQCRKPFTVKVGTIFEASKVPMHVWLQAIHLLCSSKKGISTNQLHRILGVHIRTAWFISHRIREAMRSGELAPMGRAGGYVEVDETFIGNDRTIKPKGSKKGRGYHHKHKVLSLVERDTGQKRSMEVDDLKADTLVLVLRENIKRKTHVMTDEASHFAHLGEHFTHDFVSHGVGEYGRGEIHTNTLEGAFSIFKRGMKCVYQHCGKQHLHRYLAEFDFRYNNRIALGIDDEARAGIALCGIISRRLTYRDSR
jgi:transposase-like protein